MKKAICLFLCVLSFAGVLTLWTQEGIAASDSYVKILEIEPDPSIPLVVGKDVHFKARIKYQVKEASAMISLLIQRGGSSQDLDVFLGSVEDVLTQGKGSITLEKTVRIPDTKVLQVFTFLKMPEQTKTTTVDMKYYKVIK